jgi:hypothetical protein
MKKNKGIGLVGILIIITAVLIAGWVIYYGGKSSNTLPQENQNNIVNNVPNTGTPGNNVVGADRDAHGCIGSAGYTWCAVKNKCLRTWEEKCELTSPPINSAISTTLPAPYISARSGWPPVIKNLATAYSCISLYSDIEPGETVEKNIDGRKYCVSSSEDGDVGNIYKTYTYKTPFGSGIKTTTFILRYISCGGYGEPKNIQCETNQSNFNIDTVVASLM